MQYDFICGKKKYCENIYMYVGIVGYVNVYLYIFIYKCKDIGLEL